MPEPDLELCGWCGKPNDEGAERCEWCGFDMEADRDARLYLIDRKEDLYD